MDVVRGSDFRAVPWIPLVDAHGIDRAYSLDGIGRPALVQVKTSAAIDSKGRYEWDFRAASVAEDGPIWNVLAISDRHGMPIGDTYWLVDSATVRKLAAREFDRALRTDVYHLRMNPRRESRLSPYRCTREELWRRLFPDERLAATVQLGFPTLKSDQGGAAEFATITDLMLGNHKDLLILRPAFDIHGRDLLLVLVGTPLAIYLQIKGTAVRNSDGSVSVHVGRSTFKADDDFWIVVRAWDRRLGAIHPECWLFSSKEFVRRTAHQRNVHYRTFDGHLDPQKDRWADRRHPASEMADVLRDALHGLRRAA